MSASDAQEHELLSELLERCHHRLHVEDSVSHRIQRQRQFFALGLGSHDAVFIQEVCLETGLCVRFRICMDSIAARQIKLRRCIAPSHWKHMSTRPLHGQEVVLDDRVTIGHTPGEGNLASLGTKLPGVARNKLLRHFGGIRSMPGSHGGDYDYGSGDSTASHRSAP